MGDDQKLRRREKYLRPFTLFQGRSKSPAASGQTNKAESQANNGKSQNAANQEPPSDGEQMWKRVFEQLDEEELELLKKHKVPVGEINATLTEIKNAAETQKQICTGKETFRLFGKDISLRDAAEKVVRSVEKFERVGDVATAADPIHAGLPWAGIKIILKVTKAAFDERASIISGMGVSWEMINRLQVYMDFRFHVPQSKMKENFDNAMLPLQTSLVKFLLGAIRGLSEGGTGQRFVKAVWGNDAVEGFDEKCEKLVKRVEDAAQACHRELSRKGEEGLKKQLETILEKSKEIGKFKLSLDTIQTVVEDIWRSMEGEKRGNILAWVSKDSPDSRHQTTKSRVKDTCEWILTENAFQNWKSGEGERLLWLCGTVGTGKTFLTSKVIDDIQSSLKENEALAYFYCDNTSTHDKILPCFVKQLATPKGGEDVIHTEIAKKYEDRQRSGNLEHLLSCEEIEGLFEKLAESLSKVFLVLDGFDECGQKSRDEIAKIFGNLLKFVPGLWIFVSGRPDVASDLPPSRVKISTESKKTRLDIEKFINSQIESLQNPSRPKKSGQLLRDDADLRKQVEETILEKSDGMFQWTALQMNQILNLRTSRAIRAQLRNFPKDLVEAYDAIFTKIENLDEEQRKIAERTFQWVIAGEENDWLDQRIVRAGVQQDYEHDTLQPVSPDVDIDYILDACQNLVVCEDDRFRWSHISVREYLNTHKQPLVRAAETTVGCVILVSLMVPPSAGELEEDSKIELRNYSYQFWPGHARVLDRAERNSRPRKLLRKFFGLDHSATTSPFARWFDHNKYYDSKWEMKNHPLWAACYFELESTVEDILAAGIGGLDLEDTNRLDYTILEVATRQRNKSMVESLLKRGAKPTIKAIKQATDDISSLGLDSLQLLVKHGDNVDIITVAARYASQIRYGLDQRILREVLEMGKTSHTQKWYDYYKLRGKILNDDVDGLRAALEENSKGQAGEKIDVNYFDDSAIQDGHRSCRPLLIEAAEFNRVRAVQLLLDHGADVNKRLSNPDGFRAWDALGAAVIFNAKESLLLLLKRGANPNTTLIYQGELQSVLSMAVMKGKTEFVELLVDNKANANGEGETLGLPLREALFREEYDIAAYLIKEGADATRLRREWVTEYVESYITERYTVLARRRKKDTLLLLRDHGGPVEEADLKRIEEEEEGERGRGRRKIKSFRQNLS